MNVVLCQSNIVWEDPQANFIRVRQMLGGGEISAKSLVILPEMFSTGFSMNVDKLAEGEPAQTSAFLEELAKKYQSAVMGGLVTRAEGEVKGWNELWALGPVGENLVRYQKNRSFRYNKEHECYQCGSEVVTFEWAGFKICPLICYDLRFPELFRRGVAQGAQVFVVVASWPSPRLDHWSTLLRARAIENQAYVIGVNRCGEDPNSLYPGASVVIDPHGKVIVDAGKDEGTVSAELSLAVVEGWRKEFPALVDLEIT